MAVDRELIDLERRGWKALARAVARRQRDEPYRTAMASTWVRRAGGYQQTPV